MVTLLSIKLPIIPEAPYAYRNRNRHADCRLLVTRDPPDNDAVSFWEEVRKGEDVVEMNHLGKTTLNRLISVPVIIVVNAMLHAWHDHHTALIPDVHWHRYLTDLFLRTHQHDFNVIPKLQQRLDDLAVDLLCDFFTFLGEEK